jgi:putative FmdB family regulatory protein
MPLYEYECENGHRFELIRKFADPPLETCPQCGAPVHKLMSSPAFQFKGTGWYVTDYARKDSNNTGGGSKSEKSDKADKASDAAKSGGSAESKSESSGDSKSESKSETKTESKSETKPTSGETK